MAQIPGSIGSTPGQYAATGNDNTGATNANSGTAVASGTSGFVPDILALGQEACERAGVDFTEGYLLRSLRMSLDIIAMEWANHGLNLWTLDHPAPVPLTVGSNRIVLPADTIDVVACNLQMLDGANQPKNYQMARMDFASYAAIPNPTYQARPSEIFIQRSVVPVAYIWPVPNAAIYYLDYWRLRRIQNTGYATNAMDLPTRFIPALVGALSYRMAQKAKNMNPLKLADLKLDAQELFTQAKYGDTDSSSIYIAPRRR